MSTVASVPLVHTVFQARLNRWGALPEHTMMNLDHPHARLALQAFIVQPTPQPMLTLRARLDFIAPMEPSTPHSILAQLANTMMPLVAARPMPVRLVSLASTVMQPVCPRRVVPVSADITAQKAQVLRHPMTASQVTHAQLGRSVQKARRLLSPVLEVTTAARIVFAT